MIDKDTSDALNDSPTRHDVYYWTEGVIFLVEKYLFKVPRRMFELNSPVFTDMFSVPCGQQVEGMSDSAPVRLEQVSGADFERLLTLLYPIITVEGYPSVSWGASEWTSVLHLASRWEMSDVRSLAIKHLDTVATPVMKISLGKLYDHPPWIPEGFVTLCLRADPLTMEEARDLNLKDVVGCAVAREKIRAKLMEMDQTRTVEATRHGSTYTRRGIYLDGLTLRTNAVVRTIIEDIFDVQTPDPN